MTKRYTQKKWSLAELFPGHQSRELQSAFDALEEQAAAFESLRSNLRPDIQEQEFQSMVQNLEELTLLAHRIYSFAGLWFTEDTQNQAAQALQAQVEELMAELQNRTLFFELWWKYLDGENAKRLMSSAGDVSYWLEEMRHFTPHTLTEPEEKILNIKNVTGFSALNTLYDSITNRYTFTVTLEGEEKTLTRGELMVYARHHDPDLRKAAYQELYRVYGEEGPILGQIYQTIVRDWQNEHIKLRSYSSPISVRNLRNDIPDEAVETLLSVCEKNAPIFQQFFALKARWIKMDRLRRYDVYAPVAESDQSYDFSTGVEMVLDAFDTFEPRIASLAQQVLEDEHVDSEVRPGKQSGAFCWSVTPDLTPWVKLNYQGRADDVATMAHEFGHAVHALLAADHSVFTYHSSLPLAENASTFAEMLLIEKLLAAEGDPAVRRDLLFKQVDDSYATILRQAFFAIFEQKAHQMIKDGALIDEISDMYYQTLEKQFGESVALSEEFRWEWVSIPHIYHTPFYVYAYSFGQLLVLSLYQRYKQEGESFIPGYLKILEAGGSAAPEDILAGAGVEIDSSSFWQGGFDVIKALVKELEDIPIS